MSEPSQYLVVAAEMVVFPCTCIHYRERPTNNPCPRCSLVFEISQILENTDMLMSIALNLYEAVQKKDLEKFKVIMETINTAIDSLE